jgi:hypothetical protein
LLILKKIKVQEEEVTHFRDSMLPYQESEFQHPRMKQSKKEATISREEQQLL